MVTADSNEVLVWGATGHARVVVPMIQAVGKRATLIVDRRWRELESPFEGVPIHSPDLLDEVEALPPFFVVAVGGDRGLDRIAIHELLARRGSQALTLIHKDASVDPSVHLGEGTQVCMMAALSVNVRAGLQCIVNTSASIDHDCILGDGVHVMPGAVLAGEVHVGRAATIGTNSTIVPRIVVGEEAMVGAGSVVLADVAPGTTVAGNPARMLTHWADASSPDDG